MPDPMQFDLDLKEESIQLKKTGVLTDYTLKELDGMGRKKWQQLCDDAAKTKGGVVISIKDPVGLQHKLIVMSMFDKDNKPVEESFVRTWPASTQLAIFLKVRELSGLDKEAAETAKND